MNTEQEKQLAAEVGPETELAAELATELSAEAELTAELATELNAEAALAAGLDIAPDTDAALVSMRDCALDILQAIWNWDYVHWEHMEPLVTGPIATLLRNNMAESEEAPSRLLQTLCITESGWLEHENKHEDKHEDKGGDGDRVGWVKAVYTWKECQAAADADQGSETMVWVFLREDGRWKACSVGRDVPV